MNARNTQELQIVEAFSAISVPEKIMQESNIKELAVEGLIAIANGENPRIIEVRLRSFTALT